MHALLGDSSTLYEGTALRSMRGHACSMRDRGQMYALWGDRCTAHSMGGQMHCTLFKGMVNFKVGGYDLFYSIETYLSTY